MANTTTDQFVNIPLPPDAVLVDGWNDTHRAAAPTERKLTQQYRLLQPRGTYLTVGSPIKFSEFTTEITASPLFGEHTDDVLTELGHNADTIAALHAKGVV
jgi:crotonobetainyl-CoA:carnitine CoA-transferase CaiB-like acyl-CoA transferase